MRRRATTIVLFLAVYGLPAASQFCDSTVCQAQNRKKSQQTRRGYNPPRATSDAEQQQNKSAEARVPLAQKDMGWWSIEIADAFVGEVPIENLDGSGTRDGPVELVVIVRIYNKSADRKLQYKGANSNVFLSHASLRDDLGNSYKAVSFGIEHVFKQKREGGIYPGKSIGDVYVFQPPVKTAKKLTMTLGGEAFESEKDIQLDFISPSEKGRIERENAQAADERNRKAAEELLKRNRIAEEAAHWRSWTKADGTALGRARFMGMGAGKVKLKKDDGSIITTGLSDLCADDQAWIKDRAKHRQNGKD